MLHFLLQVALGLGLTLFGFAWYPCSCGCAHCQTDPPDECTVTIAGVGNDDCTLCAAVVNGTFVLPFIECGVAWARYALEVTDTFCGGACNIQVLISYDDPADERTIEVTVGDGPLPIIVWTYTETSVTEPFECNGIASFTMPDPPDSEPDYCDVTSATCYFETP